MRGVVAGVIVVWISKRTIKCVCVCLSLLLKAYRLYYSLFLIYPLYRSIEKVSVFSKCLICLTRQIMLENHVRKYLIFRSDPFLNRCNIRRKVRFMPTFLPVKWTNRIKAIYDLTIFTRPNRRHPNRPACYVIVFVVTEHIRNTIQSLSPVHSTCIHLR